MNFIHRLSFAAVAAVLCVACSSDDDEPATTSAATATTGGTGGQGATGGSGGGSGGTRATGGGGSGGAPTTTFAEERVYVNEIFATPEECMDAQQEGANCTRIVQFCPDGSAAVMVTDIVISGSYEIDGASIAASWRSGDVPSMMLFTQTSDTEILDDSFGLTWTWSVRRVGLIACN
jgi:hypothetical protein